MELHELISASTMKTNRGDTNLKVICLHCKAPSNTNIHYSSRPGGLGRFYSVPLQPDSIESDFSAVAPESGAHFFFSVFPP